MKLRAVLIHAIAALALAFVLGYQHGQIMRAQSDAAALYREIADNAATMSALSDRLIRLTEAVTMETVASFYGEDHRGRLTASGVPFNPDELTAASPWLPFGSVWHGRCLRVAERWRQSMLEAIFTAVSYYLIGGAIIAALILAALWLRIIWKDRREERERGIGLW